jgi:polar amino acid transport system permease protein
VRTETFRTLEVLNAMALFYWLMSYPQAKLANWIHRRFKVTE